MTTKLCIDCQWMGSTRTPDDPFCNHPDVPKSLVNGKTVTKCIDNRHNAAICGIEGKLFSSKVEAKAKEEAEAKKQVEVKEKLEAKEAEAKEKEKVKEKAMAESHISHISQQKPVHKPVEKPVGETQKVYGHFPTVSDRASQVIKKKAKGK